MASGVSSIFGRPTGDASLATNFLRASLNPRIHGFKTDHGRGRLLLEHDLFRKPLPTFRDHARCYRRARARCLREGASGGASSADASTKRWTDVSPWAATWSGVMCLARIDLAQDRAGASS